MTSDNHSGAYVVPDGVIVQHLSNGEVVILNLDTEAYFGLDGVGARFFDLLAEGSSVSRAHETLLEEYDVDREVLGQDLAELLSTLVGRGLIQTVP